MSFDEYRSALLKVIDGQTPAANEIMLKQFITGSLVKEKQHMAEYMRAEVRRKLGEVGVQVRGGVEFTVKRLKHDHSVASVFYIAATEDGRVFVQEASNDEAMRLDALAEQLQQAASSVHSTVLTEEAVTVLEKTFETASVKFGAAMHLDLMRVAKTNLSAARHNLLVKFLSRDVLKEYRKNLSEYLLQLGSRLQIYLKDPVDGDGQRLVQSVQRTMSNVQRLLLSGQSSF